MTDHFSHSVRVHLYKIVIVILFLATAISFMCYWVAGNPKFESISAGLATGLFVALIQYLLQWNEHKEISLIKQLGIVKILPHRDDTPHYRKLISGAKKNIDILGTTVSRLLEDFAHRDRPDLRELVEALKRGVKIRILIPKHSYLTESDRPRAEVALARLRELVEEHSDHLDYRHFDHPPAHNIMKLDEQCLVGPIFPGVSSKDSPTVHVISSSPLANEYLRYFEKEWKLAQRE